MFKKLWLMALSSLALLFPVLSLASADTVDWFTSDSTICTTTPELYDNEDGTYTFSDSTLMQEGCYDSENYLANFCVESSDTPYDLTYYYYWGNYSDRTVSVSNSVVCFDWNYALAFTDDSLKFNKNWTFKFYYSMSEITPPSSSAWGSDSDWSISVPSWFTDSVNWLVSNFAWSIWNYAPTLIIVWLGVVLLFTFWWIIRSWAVRIFNRKWR